MFLPNNRKLRKFRGSLSKSERLSYIKAVKCLQAKPPRTPSSVAPGVKNRFDDFVASHIIQTSTIHYTGNFLSWHRYFTWAYEEALRKECGYQGAQPVIKSLLSDLESHTNFCNSTGIGRRLQLQVVSNIWFCLLPLFLNTRYPWGYYDLYILP